ncbi:recombinase family protein [Dermacoccus nishinomiyaensis]|uniref:recombinase family protein n=1 Tax=Dermacoccus nishinomiyaensis TaxID=1274 RepID=UPI003F6ADCAC
MGSSVALLLTLRVGTRHAGSNRGVRARPVDVAESSQATRGARAVDELFTDHQSGKSRANRAGLLDALRYVRRGDTLRVASMGRLARSLIDLEQIVSDLTTRKVSVEFVKERLTFTPDATADPFATFQRQLIGAVAELERSYPRTPTRRHRPGQSPRRVPGPRPPPHRRTDRPRASGGGRGRSQGQARRRPWGLAPPHLRRHRRQRLRSSDRPCP